MNIGLSKKLVEKGVIREGTEFEAYYHAIGLSGNADVPKRGTFVILGVKTTPDTVLFECANAIDGTRMRFPATSILTLDGMEPQRLASIYGLAVDGGSMKQGKRRGRKPKSLQAGSK